MLYLFYLILLPITILTAADIPSITESDYLNSIHVIHGQWIETECDLVAGPLELKRIFQPQPRHAYPFAEGWHFNLPDLYTQEIPRKRAIHSPKEQFRFDYDNTHRLTALHAIHPGTQTIQQSIAIEYAEDNLGFTAKSSGGETIHYGLTPQPKNGSLLTTIRKEGYPEIRYTYIDHPVERRPLVVEKSISGRETLYFHYWESAEEGCQDPLRSLRLGKLRALYRSEASGEVPQLICNLVYEKNITKAYFASGSEIHYHFNEFEQIRSIATFVKGTLYRTQELDWNGQNVSRKAVKDARGNILTEERYEFDLEGKLIKEILAGALTGKSASETYVKTNRYDSSGRLIEVSEESGQRICYSYDASTGLLSMKCFMENDKILMRTLLKYSVDGKIQEEIQDDADTLDVNSWQNASRRTFQETSSWTIQGNPLVQTSGFYELKTGCKLVEQVTHYEYDACGHECGKRISASDGSLIHEIESHFDCNGKLLWKREKDEEITYGYDSNGLLTWSRTTSPRMTQEIHYAPNGLVIQESTSIPDRVLRQKTHTYDAHQRLISTVDGLGNVWSYTYDSLGRKESETIPQGFGQSATSHFAYDPLDRLICITDATHFQTSSIYNARGQPLSVTYADDSLELFEYTKDGRLICMTGRDGITKRAERDLFDRLVHEWVYGTDQQLIEESSYRYNGFDITEETSSKGITTTYSYDDRGRKTTEKAPFIHVDSEYTYNDKNEIVTKRERVGDRFVESRRTSESNRWKLYSDQNELLLEEAESSVVRESFHEEIITLEDGTLAICQESFTPQGCKLRRILDPLERVLFETVVSIQGKLVSRQEFQYDEQGRMVQHRILRIHDGLEIGSVVNQWKFNPCGKLSRAVENCGTPKEEITSYDYDAYGRLQTITKPDGTTLSHAFDAAGRLESFSSSDQTVNYQFSYDLQGNLIRVFNQVTGKDTTRSYAENGQIATEILENGLKTEYHFDTLGRKTSLILPDHSRIDYLYDALFLKEVQRVNVQGHHLYKHCYMNFDLQGVPIEQQMIGNTGTIRTEGSLKKGFKYLSTPYYEETISYSDQGQVKTRHASTPHQQIENHFEYDHLNQLSQENELHHSFDSLGCPLDTDTSITRDLNGNMTAQIRHGLHYRYQYDALNRLINVFENDISILSCTYDAFHRRTTTKHAGIEKRYLYDGNHEIGSYGASVHPQELRILGRTKDSEAHATVAIELNGEVFAPIHDLTGSICMLIDLQQKVRFHQTYSAFGKAQNLLKNGIISPWGYSGKRMDYETGLIYFGRRYYDPQQKQWATKDPLGFADGANRLAFVRNNPLSFRDHFGLAAAEEHSLSKKDQILNLLKSIGAKILHTIRKLKDYTRMGLTQTLDHMIGRGFLLLLGYYKTNAHKGCYGLGEVSDKVRISFINGILTDYASLYSTLQGLSTSHGGVNIHYIYRPTRGWVYDIIHSFLVKVGYVSSQAQALADEWKSMIAAMGGVDGGGTIIHYAHSIGAVESLRALSLLTPEEQKMIKMYTFGSPNLSSTGGEAEIHHFVSVRDGVSLLDPFGFIQACRGQLSNVLFVGSFWGIPLVDHLFSAQCYQDLWKSMGRTFIEWYGTLLN